MNYRIIFQNFGFLVINNDAALSPIFDILTFKFRHPKRLLGHIKSYRYISYLLYDIGFLLQNLNQEKVDISVTLPNISSVEWWAPFRSHSNWYCAPQREFTEGGGEREDSLYDMDNIIKSSGHRHRQMFICLTADFKPLICQRCPV